MTALSGHEPQIKISIPAAASRLLGALRRAGFEAYVVGGCVRDSLLGRTPGDWDICTSARPEQVRTVFSAYRQILTGEKHGTVAVIVGGTPYEITTYRVDGQYHDSRHPDAVRFVPQVQPDLARRDFTINAMAYATGEGLIDLYGGRSDLHACLMRCVGDPEERLPRTPCASCARAAGRPAGFCSGGSHRARRTGHAAEHPEYFRRAHLYRAG